MLIRYQLSKKQYQDKIQEFHQGYIFTAIEVKTKKGVVADHQKSFIENLNYVGAIAGVARSCQDAYDLIKRYKDDERK